MPDALPKPRHRWFAAVYDHMGDSRVLPLRRRLLHGVHGEVLEVGAGTGTNFEHYDWNTLSHLVATEPDPFMQRRAQGKLGQRADAERAKVTLSDAPAESLPFEDARFDFVISCLVLCTVSDVERSLSEMRRVLKPGGELRLLEHVAAEGAWRTVQGAVQPVYGWCSAGCRLDRRTEDLVRNAGFDLEVWQHTSFSPLHPAFLGVARR